MKDKEIRIRAVNKLKTELQNIAAHEGVSLADFLRPKLREIVNSYPEEKRKQPPLE